MTTAFLLLSNLIHLLYTAIELLCDLFHVFFFRKKRGIDYTKVRSRYTKRGLDQTKAGMRQSCFPPVLTNVMELMSQNVECDTQNVELMNLQGFRALIWLSLIFTPHIGGQSKNGKNQFVRLLLPVRTVCVSSYIQNYLHSPFNAHQYQDFFLLSIDAIFTM